MDKMAIIQSETGLEIEKAKKIWVEFEPTFDALNECAARVSDLVVNSVEQVDEMRLARETRLEIKRIRVAADKKKKGLKEDILKEGRFIDATVRLITDAARPVEERLSEMEKFAERKEAERIAARNQERRESLAPYHVDIQFVDIDSMDDNTFNTFFERAKQAYQDRIAREQAEAEERARVEREREEMNRRIAEERAKADAERIAAEEKARREREEMERQLAEERARAEAARKEVEAVQRREREAIESQERAERERQAEELRRVQAENDRIARELRERQEEEDRLAREEEERRARLEQASDVERLRVYVAGLLDVDVPTVTSPAAQSILLTIHSAMSSAKKRIGGILDEGVK